MEKVFKISSKSLIISISLVFLSFLLSIGLGAAKIPPGEIIDLFVYNFLENQGQIEINKINQIIIFEWRLPRFCLGFLVGASLAIAGCGFQGVFKNPLADPFLLGSAAGAGLGVTLIIVYNINFSFFIINSVQIGAFIGALGAVICAAFISINAGKTIPSLLLAGVATAAFLTSCQTYFMHKYYSSMQEIYSWIIGRLLTSGWDEVITITPYFLICFLIIYLFRKELDLLRLSEDEARMLGGNPNITYFIVLTASSLLTAVAVSLSGLIAFVGLVIPHIVRLTVSSSYRVMIPLSALVGGAFLTFADTFSRIVISPAELPIGIVTAFIGAPFFAFLLKASKGSF